MEFESSLKFLGWFVQMLFDKCLTATLQDLDAIAEKPDLNEALDGLLDELNSVQAILSLAQNFGSQNKDLLEFLKNLKDAAYDADDLLSEVDYYRLEQEVNDSEDVDDRLQKASTSSTRSSFHDINKATIVSRIHEIVSRLKRLVTCLRKALSLLQPEEDLRANPNVFPVASHPLTTSFLLPNEKRFSRSLYRGNHLEVLAEDEFLAMFNKCAFSGEDPNDHLELVEIAKQIAQKLKGSSFAARIVGGLLRDNLDEHHWRSVLCSDIWQQQESPDDSMPILRFSYHHLPARLQQCFAYFGVFPKDWEFEKEKLVGMWISQGYVHTKSGGNMSPEEIGREYFDNLLSKSFIQARTEKTYVLHRLLHDLAESVSEDECLRINSNRKKKITSRVRHIYARGDNLSLLKNCNLRNLRTLIIYRIFILDEMNVLKKVLNEQKSIRVLCLTDVDVSVRQLSGCIGHLIHLRYLTVRNVFGKMRPPMMPDFHCRPYHLQWLISETRHPIDLPAPSNCLVSLRHLKTEIENKSGIGKMTSGIEKKSGIWKMTPGIENKSGIGKMTHLKELESFIVGTEEGQKLGELNRLNELGGTLKLRCIENVSTKEEALEANLNQKTGIRELELSCYVGHASSQMAEEVFEGLRPPPFIKKLTLYRFNGVKSPSWMVTKNICLSYLQSLYLVSCSFWKVLPTLGDLPLLKHLKIDGAHSVEEIGSNFYGSGVGKAFPCLDTLEFTDMQKLVVWSGIEFKDTSGWVVSSRGKDMFPLLRQLIVTDCPKIKRVPHMTSVELLQTNCLRLLNEIENLTSLKKLLIQNSREIESLPILPALLVTLEIHDCPKLLSLFSLQLSSLEKLYIYRCYRIQSVPLLPTTLKQLHIMSLEIRSLPIIPASLQELSIDDCPILLPLFTLQLSSLEKLSICRCAQIQSVPLLPTTLKQLYIRRLEMLTAFSMKQEENLSNLTSLRDIDIRQCPNLLSLPIMPSSLEKLSIHYCARIRSLPLLPTTLEQLRISSLKMLTAFSMEQEGNLSDLTSLREVYIHDCPNLRSLTIMPASLEKLDIYRCDRIQSVPLLPTTLKQLRISSLKMLTAFSMEQEGNLSDLTSLRDIDIRHCPNLRSLPIMPASLQELSIDDCPKLPRESYQEGGDDWHKISHVPTIFLWLHGRLLGLGTTTTRTVHPQTCPVTRQFLETFKTVTRQFVMEELDRRREPAQTRGSYPTGKKAKGRGSYPNKF